MLRLTELDINRRVLEAIPLFQGLPHSTLDQLLRSFTLVYYPRGYRVLRQGHAANVAFYLVRTGWARVSIRVRDGRDQILAELGRGDTFGELEILAGGEAVATVETVLDTELWVLSREDFMSILAECPDIGLRLGVDLSERLRSRNQLPVLPAQDDTIAVTAPGLPSDLVAAFAHDLATVLRAQSGKEVALLDLDRGSVLLSSLTGSSIVEEPESLVSEGNYLDPQKLDPHIHRLPSGVHLLGIKPSAEGALRFDPSLIPLLLGFLRLRYAFVLAVLGASQDRAAVKTREQVARVLELRGFSPPDGAQWTETDDPRWLRIALERGETRDPLTDQWAGYPRGAAAYLLETRGEPQKGTPIWMAGLEKLGRRLRRARIGLALGSGTALGWTHLGVLKVLEREGVPIDLIAGSSMGALVGAFYAWLGDTARCEDFARTADEESVKSWIDYNYPFLRDGLIKGDAIEKVIHDAFGETTFHDLKTPLYVIATDLIRGTKVVLQDGLVYKAIRASASIPGVFRMAELDGRHYVDGGVFETVPARTVREYGADRVIAVNTAQDPALDAPRDDEDQRRPNIFDIFMRSIEILLYQRAQAGDSRGDVNINPRVPHIGWREFWRWAELVRCGEEAAEEHIDAIRRLVEE